MMESTKVVFTEQIHGEVQLFSDEVQIAKMSLAMTGGSKAIERQDQYMNFYQKGALIGLCLDIRLRELLELQQ